MLLNTFIREAWDGHLVLHVAELPELSPVARNVEEIAEVVKAAAAEYTGMAQNDFDVQVQY